MPDFASPPLLRAIGLMSGTSMDGIDASLLETDGHAQTFARTSLTLPYTDQFRAKLRQVVESRGETKSLSSVEAELTALHAAAVEQLLARAGLTPNLVDLIGFHGHTVLHDPPQRTWQIGDGRQLALLTGIPVVSNFRAADVAAGGQGAPLVPLYHLALAGSLEKPLAIVNIGGVANITYLGDGDPIAFDTGPGMAMIDDLFLRHTGTPIDTDGQTALAGKPHGAIIERFLSDKYFSAPVPKSLDRNAFASFAFDNSLSLPDTAATLVGITAASLARAQGFLPAPPKRWLICGGGRHNKALMQALREHLTAPVDPVEAAGWNGDTLEAEAFAYLAVRAKQGLPLTLPTTTGVKHPLSGGVLYNAPGR